MNKIALAILGWFIGGGIAINIITIAKLIKLTKGKKEKNEKSK